MWLVFYLDLKARGLLVVSVWRAGVWVAAQYSYNVYLVPSDLTICTFTTFPRGLIFHDDNRDKSPQPPLEKVFYYAPLIIKFLCV